MRWIALNFYFQNVSTTIREIGIILLRYIVTFAIDMESTDSISLRILNAENLLLIALSC